MAGSKYAYVRNFELPDPVLPETYMIVRIDGKGFHKFSAAHDFVKPNDPRGLELMNAAARHVMQELKGSVLLAFGESDEYSFLLSKACNLYSRRSSKITTHIVSLFTGAYVHRWSEHFPGVDLKAIPSFDGRLVVYPGAQQIRDYFAWRQADTHINNLYNTVFWALVQQGGQSEKEAHHTLKGTVSSQKHELMHSQFGINYNELPQMYRKGTTIVWAPAPDRRAGKTVLRVLHVDIIGDTFWGPSAGEAPEQTAAPPDAQAGEAWQGPSHEEPTRLDERIRGPEL